MNARELSLLANHIAGGIEARRWQLARLALRARNDGAVREWAEVIGRTKNVRRAARTVREWASTLEFYLTVRAHMKVRPSDLTFSGWGTLSRKSGKVEWEDVLDMTETAIQNGLDQGELSELVSDAVITGSDVADFRRRLMRLKAEILSQLERGRVKKSLREKLKTLLAMIEDLMPELETA